MIRVFEEIKVMGDECERCCLRKTPTAGLRAPLVSGHCSMSIELFVWIVFHCKSQRDFSLCLGALY